MNDSVTGRTCPVNVNPYGKFSHWLSQFHHQKVYVMGLHPLGYAGSRRNNCRQSFPFDLEFYTAVIVSVDFVVQIHTYVMKSEVHFA